MMFPESFEPYAKEIEFFELIVLVIFTIELFARMFASKSITDFLRKPSNWIDILAVAPFYFGIQDAFILRLFRLLRIFKLLNSFTVLKTSNFFDFRHSILRVVTPLIVIFMFLKGFIWLLELNGFWFIETDFKTLFTIIGFSLGVVLSQKI